MTNLSGKILHSLNKYFEEHQHKKMFIEFIKKVKDDKKFEVREAIAFNLPFYYITFKEEREFLQETYLHYSIDESVNVKKTLSAGIHETMGQVD